MITLTVTVTDDQQLALDFMKLDPQVLITSALNNVVASMVASKLNILQKQALTLPTAFVNSLLDQASASIAAAGVASAELPTP